MRKIDRIRTERDELRQVLRDVEAMRKQGTINTTLLKWLIEPHLEGDDK